MNGAFDGVRVLSLAEQLPGPYATLLMADQGADVIMIERPKTGDPARAFPDFFASVARNKRSVCLDLKDGADLERFRDQVSKADVVLEGYAPGTAARLRIGYEDLKEVNPRLIYVSLSGFGQTGVYRDRPAHDLSYQAVAGLLQPQDTVPSLPFGDIAGAMFAAWAISTALYARERTGLGTYIDVSMADSLASWMTPLLGPVMNDGMQINLQDNPVYGVFHCRDGTRLSLSIAHEDHFWRQLCPLLGMASFADLNLAQRLKEGDHLRKKVATAISVQDGAHWARVFDAHRVPWSPVQDASQVIHDPHFRSRGLFEQVEDAQGLTQMHVRQPVIFSAYATGIKRLPPRLGQHTDEVLKG